MNYHWSLEYNIVFHPEILFSTLKAVNIIENSEEVTTDEQEKNNPTIHALNFNILLVASMLHDKMYRVSQ